MSFNLNRDETSRAYDYTQKRLISTFDLLYQFFCIRKGDASKRPTTHYTRTLNHTLQHTILHTLTNTRCSITMYDPLKYFDVKEYTSVAVVGCGGLGMMGIKLAQVCKFI